MRLQLQHHLSQSFVRDLILDLFFVRLRDLIILTIDAAQIAVAEENVSGSAATRKRRLFAEVCRVRRDDWQPTRVAARQFIFEPVVPATEWTNRAMLEQRLQRFNTSS